MKLQHLIALRDDVTRTKAAPGTAFGYSGAVRDATRVKEYEAEFAMDMGDDW